MRLIALPHHGGPYDKLEIRLFNSFSGTQAEKDFIGLRFNQAVSYVLYGYYSFLESTVYSELATGRAFPEVE